MSASVLPLAAESSSATPSSAPAIENVVIIGSGPAGLTAAIYAARANLNPVIVAGEQPGGQLTITSDVENYPGFAKPVLGPELMESFQAQAAAFGTRTITASVRSVTLSPSVSSSSPHLLELDNGSTLRTKALIIATGASAQWTGVEGEKELGGHGVSACATCDGFFFKKKDIAVVGGGDTALEEATFLTRFANTVTIIHRRDQLRASAAMQDKAKKNEKIRFVWNSVLQKINGDRKGGVTSVTIKNLKTDEVSDLPVKGLFVAIGHKPNTDLFKGQLKMDEHGYILNRPGSTLTEVEGVFAAGDVADSKYRQAVTAAGMGCQAALDAQHYLESKE